jgi:hypothetical protein
MKPSSTTSETRLISSLISLLSNISGQLPGLTQAELWEIYLTLDDLSSKARRLLQQQYVIDLPSSRPPVAGPGKSTD